MGSLWSIPLTDEKKQPAVKLDPFGDTHLDSSEAEWLAIAGTHINALEAAYRHILKDGKATYKASKVVRAWEELVKHVMPPNEANHLISLCLNKGIAGAKTLLDLENQDGKA